MSTLKHLRSSVSNKRPTASGLADGQLGINTASGTPGLYFKNTASGIVKVGPAHVGTTAPNTSPAGSAGNSTGEFWVDNSLATHGLKYYTGSTFYNLTPSGTTSNSGLVELATNAETQTGSDAERAVTPASLQSKVSDSTSTTSSTTIASSTAVKSAYDLASAALPKAGGTVTGELLLAASGSLVFEGSVDDGFETTLAVTNPTADRTITLPNVTGTVITTGDTGSVTSTMIANDTIVNADINSAAAIAFSKLATGALPSGITVNSSNIVDGSIVNADINATAAIVGTKISPDFGSQTIATTGRIGVGTTSPTTNVQLTSSAPTATIGNIYIAPTTAGQARYQLYNNGAVAEWILGQKTSTNHDFVLSKSVAGSESDYLIIDTSGNVNFQGAGTRIRNGQIIDCSGSTGNLSLYGGNADGANIELYGASHATLANLAVFDAGEHRFRSVDGLTERVRIDSSGRLLIAQSSSLAVGGGAGQIQVNGANSFTGIRWNSSGGASFIQAASRAAAPGSFSIASSGDTVSRIRAYGDDGTQFVEATRIDTGIDGPPGVGSMPGRLTFSTTPSGAASSVERMRINSAGYIGINTLFPDSQLTIANAGSASADQRWVTFLNGIGDNNFKIAAWTGASGNTNGSVLGSIGLSYGSTRNAYIDYHRGSSTTGGFMSFTVNDDSEAMRLDSSGRLLVGTSTALGVATSTPASILIETATGALPIAVTRNSADATGPIVAFGKSRGVTAGSLDLVANNDILGELRFAGADGSTRSSMGAQIQARVDGVTASGEMPGRLVFSTTPSGSASPVERMRITSSGLVAYDQPVPLARNTSATLTVADLKTKIIVSAPASGITLTLPSGGLLEADFPSIYAGVTFDWSIINTSATNAITLASGVGHTIVGSGGIAANVSARFTTRRTATSNTFISYRLC